MRIIVENDNKIFGLPLILLDKPNLISLFDQSTNLLKYFPLNGQNSEILLDYNNILASTLISFKLNKVTDYKGVEDHIVFAQRENEIIENIIRADSSIYDLVHFNSF